MTQGHMNKYGEDILQMFQEESRFYTSKLLESIQKEFDYTNLLDAVTQKVYAIYGDRNKPQYSDRINDLNLSDKTLKKLELKFISDACHMIMIENPKQLYETIESILGEE